MKELKKNLCNFFHMITAYQMQWEGVGGKEYIEQNNSVRRYANGLKLSNDKPKLINDTILLADMLTNCSCPKTGITQRHNTVGRYAYGFATIYQNKSTTRHQRYTNID